MIQSFVSTNGLPIRIYEWSSHSYIRLTVSFEYTKGCTIRIYEWLQPIEQRRVMAVHKCWCRSRGKYRLNNVPRSNRALVKAVKGRYWSLHTPFSQPSRHSYLRMPVPPFQWPSPATMTSNAPKRKADLTKVAPSPADSLKRPPNTTPTSVWGHPRAIPSFTCKMLTAEIGHIASFEASQTPLSNLAKTQFEGVFHSNLRLMGRLRPPRPPSKIIRRSGATLAA